MPNAMATITTSAPKSGSSSSSAARSRPSPANSGRKPLHQRLLQRLLGMQERRLAHGVARGVQHDGELHEFGRLQVDDGERQPAARAVDRPCRCRGRSTSASSTTPPAKSHGAQALPRLHRHLEARRTPRASADGDEHRVPREEIPGAEAGVRGSLGHRDRRRVHHHEPDREQAGSRTTRATRRRRASSADCAAARRASSTP